MWILIYVICDHFSAHLEHTYGHIKTKFGTCNDPHLGLILSKCVLILSNVDHIVGFEYQPVILLLSKTNSNDCVKLILKLYYISTLLYNYA